MPLIWDPIRGNVCVQAFITQLSDLCFLRSPVTYVVGLHQIYSERRMAAQRVVTANTSHYVSLTLISQGNVMILSSYVNNIIHWQQSL
jgi:hypothetical protein